MSSVVALINTNIIIIIICCCCVVCCWHHHHCYYFMINSSFLFLNIIDEDSQPITHGVCRKGVVEGSVCSVRRCMSVMIKR